MEAVEWQDNLRERLAGDDYYWDEFMAWMSKNHRDCRDFDADSVLLAYHAFAGGYATGYSLCSDDHSESYDGFAGHPENNEEL